MRRPTKALEGNQHFFVYFPIARGRKRNVKGKLKQANDTHSRCTSLGGEFIDPEWENFYNMISSGREGGPFLKGKEKRGRPLNQIPDTQKPL